MTSSSFLKFWESVTDSKNREQIINDNKVGLTRELFFCHLILMLKILLKGGWGKCNVIHVFWKAIIINNKMPFIKIDLLRDNYLHLSNIAQYKDVVRLVGDDYPIELIDKHLAGMANEK